MIKKIINHFFKDFFIDVSRQLWVEKKLLKLRKNLSILDAGCGDQKYRKYTQHLNYKSQDFGLYSTDNKKTLGTSGMGGKDGYKYGALDYECDIVSIPVKNNSFDVILCTEVFEHLPDPNLAIAEFSRILRSNGDLFLTVPSNCLRHMDPYFYYSGFSDNWLKQKLKDNNFIIKELDTIGDYYSWMSFELYRTLKRNILFLPFILPSLIFFLLKKKTTISSNTLCKAYFIHAKKK